MYKEIKIGTAAKIIGKSPQLLRHYEKKEVVTPVRVDESGYRYYSRSRISHLAKARYLLSLGFSIPEVVEHNTRKRIHGATICDWTSTIDRHIDQLEQTIKKEQLLLDTLKGYRERLDSINQKPNTYTLEACPEMLFLAFSNDRDEIISNDYVMSETGKWVNRFPVAAYSFYCNKNYFNLDTTDKTIQRGFCIPLYGVDITSIKNKRFLKYISSKQSVHTIGSCNLSEPARPSIFKDLQNYIHENHYEIDGDGFGVWIADVREEENIKKYFDLWIPVKS